MARQGQSWSMDVVLAVVIFGFLAIIFTSFGLLQEPDIEKLQTGAQGVSNVLATTPVSNCGQIVNNDTINQQGISCLYGKGTPEYDQIKQQLNLKGDFCIYLEDENGQILQINGQNSWGDSNLLVGGVPCGN